MLVSLSFCRCIRVFGLGDIGFSIFFGLGNTYFQQTSLGDQVPIGFYIAFIAGLLALEVPCQNDALTPNIGDTSFGITHNVCAGSKP